MFKRRIYIENNLDPFPISRTKIDLFFECRRCFYLDLKFGIKRPHGTPLVINNRIIDDESNLKCIPMIKPIIKKIIIKIEFPSPIPK